MLSILLRTLHGGWELSPYSSCLLYVGLQRLGGVFTLSGIRRPAKAQWWCQTRAPRTATFSGDPWTAPPRIVRCVAALFPDPPLARTLYIRLEQHNTWTSPLRRPRAR